MTTAYGDALQAHYERAWCGSPIRRSHQRGPVRQLPTGFTVLEFPPWERRALWTYATLAMSPPDTPQPLELFMLARDATPRIVELLTIVTHYHATGARLGWSHTVNFGEPWLPGSACDHGLVSLPYLDGPLLEEYHPPRGSEIVRCLWLIPITKAEREYKITHGLDALEQRFEAKQFDYSDPLRLSVV